MLIYVLDLFGIAVFAITGALVARDRQLDVFGGVVLALVTAVGGGTFRDVVLGIRPVFWVADSNYVWVASVTALATFFVLRYYKIPGRPLLLADAFGLAIFTVMGTERALAHAAPPTIAIVMGVMTGSGGGMIRDVLAGQVPLVLRKEIYATAALSGAAFFVAARAFDVPATLATITAVIVVFLLRLAGIRWGWALPVFRGRGKEGE